MNILQNNNQPEDDGERHERIQSYVDRDLIKPTGLVVNQQPVRKAAKLLGRQGLVTEAHKLIHSYEDQDPGGSHVVTTKAVVGGTGFLVGMMCSGGMFADFAITFEIDPMVSEPDAIFAMESLAEDAARDIYAKKFAGREPVCECCR
jgi:hypothetical protein